MTDSNWPAALALVLRHEGGFVNHPLDPGGATNFGVTRRTLAGWRGVSPWWRLPRSAVRELGSDEAGCIYRDHYWQTINAAALPAGLDLAMFDFAVNSGPQRAVKTLQYLVGAKADGILGPNTLSAMRRTVAEAGIAALIDRLSGKRLGFLQSLGGWLVFGSGWRARVEDVRRAALAMAATGDHPASAPVSPPSTNTRSRPVDILSGYKTYIIALVMLLAGVTQLLGIDVPSFDSQSAGQLIVQALAVIFLRKGISASAQKP